MPGFDIKELSTTDNTELKYTSDRKIINPNSGFVIAELNSELNEDEAGCIGQQMATASKLLNSLENLLDWWSEDPDFEDEPCFVEARKVVNEANGG